MKQSVEQGGGSYQATGDRKHLVARKNNQWVDEKGRQSKKQASYGKGKV